jgi:galactose mutarotase-like enzyme
MIPSVYRNVLNDVAADNGQTDVAFIGSLADETATFAENTLTMSDGYQQDDDGDLLPTGLIAGLIQACVLDALDTPQHVQDHIDTTRALDGTQEDAWGDYQARWTYHPDNGMNITVWTDGASQ